MVRWPYRGGIHSLGIFAALLLLLTVFGTVKGSIMQHPPLETMFYKQKIAVQSWEWPKLLGVKNPPKTFDVELTLTPLLKDSLVEYDAYLAPVYSKKIKVKSRKTTKITIDEVLDAGIYQIAFTFKDFGRVHLEKHNNDSEEDTDDWVLLHKRRVSEGKVTVNFGRPVRVEHGEITLDNTELYKKMPLTFSFFLEESLKEALGSHVFIKMHPVMVLDEDDPIRMPKESDLPYVFADDLLTASDKYFRDPSDLIVDPIKYELKVKDTLFKQCSGQSFFLAVYAMARGYNFDKNESNEGAILLLTSSPFKLLNEERMEVLEEGAYLQLDFSPNIEALHMNSASDAKPPSKAIRSYRGEERGSYTETKTRMFIQRPANILFRTHDVPQLQIMGWNPQLGLEAKRLVMQRRTQKDAIVIPNPEVSCDGRITCYISDLFGPGTYGAKLECKSSSERDFSIMTSQDGIHITNRFVISPCQGQQCQQKRFDLIFDGLENTELLEVHNYKITLVAQGLSRTPGDELSPLPLTETYIVPCESTNVFKDGRVHIPLKISNFPRRLLKLALMTIEVSADVTRKDPIEQGIKWNETIRLALSDPFAVCSLDPTTNVITCPVSVTIGKSQLTPRPTIRDKTRSWDIHSSVVVPPEVRGNWRQKTTIHVLANTEGHLKHPTNYKGELQQRGRLPHLTILDSPSSPQTHLTERFGRIKFSPSEIGKYNPLSPLSIQVILGRGKGNEPLGQPKNPTHAV